MRGRLGRVGTESEAEKAGIGIGAMVTCLTAVHH